MTAPPLPPARKPRPASRRVERYYAIRALLLEASKLARKEGWSIGRPGLHGDMSLVRLAAEESGRPIEICRMGTADAFPTVDDGEICVMGRPGDLPTVDTATIEENPA